MPYPSPFNDAELLILANHYVGSGDLIDKSGNGHDATINGAVHLDHSGTNYMWIPDGTPVSNQDIAFTPTPGAMDFEDICTTTFDVRTRVSLPDLTPSAAVPLWLVVGASVMGIQLTPGGLLQTVFGNAAAATITHTASATLDAAGMTVDTDTIIRVRGSDLNTTTWLVDFDYSIDGGVTWTAIGTQRSQASVAGFFNGAYDRYVWGQRVATVRGEAKLIGLEMWADGTKYHDIQPTNIDSSTPTSITSTLGNTWTVTHATSGHIIHAVTETMVALDGVDDYLEVAHHADLNADNDFTAIVAVRTHSTPAGVAAVFSKRAAGAAPNEGWLLQSRPTDNFNTELDDGSTEVTDAWTDGFLPLSEKKVLTFRLDVIAEELEAFVNGVGTGTPTSTTHTESGTSVVRVGAHASGVDWWAGEFYAAAIWNRALSNAEVATASTLLQAGPILFYGLGDLSEADVAELASLAGVTLTSAEVVGKLNEIAGTSGLEYQAALTAAANAIGITWP